MTAYSIWTQKTLKTISVSSTDHRRWVVPVLQTSSSWIRRSQLGRVLNRSASCLLRRPPCSSLTTSILSQMRCLESKRARPMSPWIRTRSNECLCLSMSSTIKPQHQTRQLICSRADKRRLHFRLECLLVEIYQWIRGRACAAKPSCSIISRWQCKESLITRAWQVGVSIESVETDLPKQQS